MTSWSRDVIGDVTTRHAKRYTLSGVIDRRARHGQCNLGSVGCWDSDTLVRSATVWQASIVVTIDNDVFLSKTEGFTTYLSLSLKVMTITNVHNAASVARVMVYVPNNG